MTLIQASVPGQTAVTLETIAKAWQDRQGRVRSFRFVWTERQTNTKGFVTNLVDEPERLKQMGIPPGSVVPPEDVTFEVPSSICIDGNKVRYTRDDRQWSAKEKAYVLQPYMTVFNGELGKTFHSKGASYAPWPQALIQGRFPDARALYLSPLFMTFRACAPEFRSFDIQTLVLTGRRAVIDGKSCLEVERQLGSYVERVWIDPSRDYVVVRALSSNTEHPRTKIDIAYRKDADSGWVPEKWDILMFYASGKLQQSMRAKVTSYQINPPVELSEFDIEFPAGTRVKDIRDPNSPVDYIVKENDKKRMILPEEIGATYEQMIRSEPGQALGKRPQSFPFWSVALACVVAAMAGGLLLWRKWPLRKRPA
jgi:hypothetical protein